MSLKLQAEYVCDNGDFVNMVQEVTGKEYNDCCQIVANDGIYGEDGAGFYTIWLADQEEYNYSQDVQNTLKAIAEANPGVSEFKILDDF